jgi:hypothetical protein
MSDVSRSLDSGGRIAGGAGAGTLALVGAAAIAFFIAAAMLFENLSAGPVVQDQAAAPMLNEILRQQVGTRNDLTALRQAIVQQSRPGAPRPQPRTTEPPPPGRTAPPAGTGNAGNGNAGGGTPIGDEPPPDRRPEFRRALERIDGYLAVLQGGVQTLFAAATRGEGGRELRGRYEEMVATIAEARRFVREQTAAVTAEAGPLPGAEAELSLALVSEPEPPSPARLAWIKLYIVAGMFVVLGIVFVVAVFAIFLARRPAAVAFATDTVKTMLGFFIGVITAFMGAPG